MHAAGYLTVDVHLRRARLAAHAVALDIGVFTAAFADHLFQQFAHGLGGFSPDGAGHHLRRGALHNTAVLIQNGGDDIGLHQLAAIDHRRKGRDHLDRRDGYALAKADTRQINVFDIAAVNQDARALAWQIHARAHAQPKGAQVLIEPLCAHTQRQGDKHRIAAVFQPLGQRFVAMALFPAADGITVHPDTASALEGIPHAGHAGIQRRGAGQAFKGRSRLISVADSADAHQLGQRLDIVARRAVGIVIRLHAQSQNRAGVHIHHNTGDGFGVIDLDALAHGALHKALDARVDGQLHRVARLRGNVGGIALRHGARLAVHLGQQDAIFALEHRVVLLLQP